MKKSTSRFTALLVAIAMIAAIFPAMVVSAQETVALGEFNYPHDWAPRWNADGVNDATYPLQWEDVVSAVQLVVELSDVPEGTVELVMQSDGNNWWGQAPVFNPDYEEGTTIVVDLADVAGWDAFISEGPGRFGLSFIGDIIVSAHLVLGDAPAAPVAIAAPVAVGASGQSVLRLVTDSTAYDLDGVQGTLEVAPINVDGRTLIPFRFIGETMGAVVTHTPATDATPLIAHFALDNINVDITMGVDIFHNGVNIGTPDIVDGRTLVPVRVAEMMGAEVVWEPVARAVYVIFGEDYVPELPTELPIEEEEEEVEEEIEEEIEEVEEEEEEEIEEAPAAGADNPPTGNVLRGTQLNASGHGSVQFDVNVTAGQEYTLSVWVMNAPGRDNFMFQWSHYPANIDGLCCGERDCDGLPSTPGEWVFHEITFTVPATNNSMMQFVSGDGGAGDIFYIADVTITNSAGVSTVIPLNAIRRHWDDSSFAVSIVPAP